MPCRRKRRMQMPRPPTGNQMMKGMVDVSKTAIGGAVMIGGISTVASIIKK